jgi:putative phosphonate metabolism protein
MDDIARYALYLIPEGALGAFGEEWLGWDAARGVALPAPEGAPADWQAITAEPRRYGFHATIKPPFRLAEGCTAAALGEAVGALCARLDPVDCAGLRLSAIEGFLALVPEGETAALDTFAARIVAELDGFRRPADAGEIARRRAAGLTEGQEANLARWGYPYVMEEFRAHFTLTGRLPPDRGAEVAAHLAGWLVGVRLRPFRVESLCLAGEMAGGGFRLLHRYALSGRGAG